MKPRSPVTLTVAGTAYRLLASVPEDELRRLGAIVQAHLPAEAKPGPNAVLLAALSLAHELDCERARRHQVETKSRDALRRVLHRIDAVLEVEAPEPGEEPGSGDDPRFT